MFGHRCALIGVVHLLPLPGSAGYKGDMERILTTAITDALKYRDNGADALMIENMHDAPYLKGFVEPETLAAMTAAALTIKQQSKLPLGIQILAGANLEALGAAVAAGLDFIRVEGYVFAHVGDEGIHESTAGKIARRRANLKAEHVKVFADVKKKHCAHAITSDIGLVETARAAEFFKADGIIVSGPETGVAPREEEVGSVKAATGCPVLVGSGVNDENVARLAPHADGLIVGSFCKEDGRWYNNVDAARVERLAVRLDQVLR